MKAKLGRMSQWVGVIALLYTSSAIAVGLGDLRLESYLNEPLQAQVELLSIEKLGEEQIKVLLGSEEDFDRAGVPRDYFLLDLDFEIEIDTDGRGQILITTENQVHEPYLNFLIELRWPTGRLLREYTILLDPVVFSEGYDSPVSEAITQRVVPAATDTRQSNAYPPSSNASQSSAPAASSAGQRWGDELGTDELMVQRNDTLWRIAERVQPEGYSVQQTMLALQRLNPDAFIGGNINRLKAGYILRVPDDSEVASRDREFAVAEVKSQIQDWREGRNSGPIEDVLRPQLDATADEGYQPANDGDGAEGVLEIASARDTEDPFSGDDLSNELIASYEDADKTRRDLLDLQTRVAELEERNRTLARLNELKDDQLKALQDELGRDPSSADPEASDPVEQPGGDNQAVADSSGSSDPPQQAIPTSAAQAPAERGIFGLLMDNLLLILGVLIAIIVAAWLFVRRRSQGDERGDGQRRPVGDEDAFADVELGDEGLIVDELTSDNVAPQAALMAAAKTDDNRDYGTQVEDVDALAEADIYIAYGRYEQAVTVLQSAIDTHPETPAYWLKLLEVHAATGDAAAFDADNARLQALGDVSANAQATALRAGLAEGGRRENDISAATNDTAGAMDVEEEFLLGVEHDQGPAEDTVADEVEEILDVDLSLDDEDLDLGAEADIEESSDLDAEDDDIGLELDEDFLADLGTEDGADALAEESAEEYELELDMEVEDEFDLSDLGEEEAADSADESSELEFDVLEEDDIDELALDDSDEDLSEFAPDDELATKLDLARAYIDMGDTDGALDILKLVSSEGSPEQQKEAEELLSKID